MNATATTPLLVRDLGRIDYATGLAAQKRALAAVQDDPAAPERFLLCQHAPATITLGRRADPANLLVSEDELARRGVELHPSRRGGDVTWHGPGQLVGYPIVRIAKPRLDLHGYLRGLEETLIRAIGRFGLSGRRESGRTGVWVGEDKVAAIGIAVSRWVTWHGLALNVCPDLEMFKLIVPCGIADKGVTSMARLLGRDISVQDVQPVVVECFCEVFGRVPMVEETAP